MPKIPQTTASSKPLPSPKKQLTALGAYIFAGGFTLGVSKHFSILGHLEETDYGVATSRKNFPRLPIYVDPESWPLESLAKQQIDFVYGNPPCAAWSVAGYTKTRGTDKWRSDPRVACTSKHFSLIAALRPKVWVWESVTQAFTKGREFVDNLANEAAELGYSTTILLHDARWFGLPQIRKRFFMVCHRVPFTPITPDWSQEVTTPVETLEGLDSSGEPCWGASKTEARWTEDKIVNIAPGERLAKHWEKNYTSGPQETWERNSNGAIKGRPSFGHFRLPTDRPGGAVVGYGIIHPTEHRFISTEEMQVLSGFPQSYIFTPNRPNKRMGEIAKGVCPPVAAWLAKSVAKSLNRYSLPIATPITTLCDFRKPGIEPVILERSRNAKDTNHAQASTALSISQSRPRV